MADRVKLRTGEELTILINDLTQQGRGVGKYKGITVFVPGALPGEEVLCRVTSWRKSYAEASLSEILDPSPYRLGPPCEHYHLCGGCQLQHLDYEHQLSWKRKNIQETLKRLGKLEVQVNPVLGMDHPWQYRNKVQLHVSREESGVVIGYYAPESHRAFDIKACLLLPQEFQNPVTVLRQLLSKSYSSTGKLDVARLLLRYSTATGDFLIVFVTRTAEPALGKDLLQELLESCPSISSVVQNVNSQPKQPQLGPQDIVLCGKGTLREKLDDLLFDLSPRAFFQINSRQTTSLYQTALSYAEPLEGKNVLDLYCGVGSISLFLARQAKQVTGIESVAAAVEDARKNACLNHIDNTTFLSGTAEKLLPRLIREGHYFEIIVLDPPRAGCDPMVIENIVQARPETIVYVSCNPSTLARDLNMLTAKGYQAQEAQPVDMFPQTGHTECVVFCRKG